MNLVALQAAKELRRLSETRNGSQPVTDLFAYAAEALESIGQNSDESTEQFFGRPIVALGLITDQPDGALGTSFVFVKEPPGKAEAAVTMHLMIMSILDAARRAGCARELRLCGLAP